MYTRIAFNKEVELIICLKGQCSFERYRMTEDDGKEPLITIEANPDDGRSRRNRRRKVHVHFLLKSGHIECAWLESSVDAAPAVMLSPAVVVVAEVHC